MAGNAADVYAQSFFELAKESGVLPETARELTEIAVVMEGFPELKRLLTLPTITVPEKQDIITKVFGEHISELSANFLKVLAAKRRIGDFSKISVIFQKKYNRSQNMIDVFVTSAAELSDMQKEALSEKLTKKYNKTVKLHFVLDPSLVGGLVLEIDGKKIDGSVKTKLDEIQTILAAATA
ncbi:MAG: ATP synthase F1 subunit delta [Ruminococcus sp.]|jgi:F-type H+-transporting ATPase subunit delta|nr:ATP synthase F1 subunit delta [Ruminococcus sp.]